MEAANDVVITGLGVVSPIGTGKAAVWDSLQNQHSGIGPFFEDAGAPVRLAAPLSGFQPKEYIRPRKSLKVMCNQIQAGVAAASLAVEDATLGEGGVDPDRFGVVFGSEIFYSDLSELEEVYRNCIVDGQFDFSNWGSRMMGDIFPLWMLKYLPNMVACHVGIAQDARGPNNTIAVGEASSLLALQECVRVIQRGHADVMIAGGTGSRLDLGAVLFPRRQQSFSPQRGSCGRFTSLRR